MVDDVGIVQHADGTCPLRASGYCTDDVARLAIVALGLGQTTGAEAYHRMLARSLGFLRHAWSAERGGMRNFMSYDRRWLDEPHGGDHLGRAAWALGRGRRGRARSRALLEPSLILLREMLPALAEQRWPRTMAFAALGLARADPGLGDERPTSCASSPARLADLQRANASPDWYWAEDVLTYDNARLPQALIAAGDRLGDADMLARGHARARLVRGRARHRRPVAAARRPPRPAPRRAAGRQPATSSRSTPPRSSRPRSRRSSPPATSPRAPRGARLRVVPGPQPAPARRSTTSPPAAATTASGATDVNGNEGAESTLAYLQALLALDAAGLQATLPE